MNERIKELAYDAGIRFSTTGTVLAGDQEGVEKLAELIVKESCRLMQERWYELNDEPAADGETLRDVGIRVGKKSELIRMKQVLASYFGIK